MKNHLIYALVIGFLGIVPNILIRIFLSSLPFNLEFFEIPVSIFTGLIVALLAGRSTIKLSAGLAAKAIKTRVMHAVWLSTSIANLIIFSTCCLLMPFSLFDQDYSTAFLLALASTLSAIIINFILGFAARLFVRQQPGLNP